MVLPDYQGKGYGKKATQFGINKVLDSGEENVYLCFIKGNDRAQSLYTSLGFELVQDTHVYRKLLDK